MGYVFDLTVLAPYSNALLHAFLWTLALAASSSVLGIVSGTLWGIVLASDRRELLELRWVLSLASDVVRGIPPLVLLLLVNFAVAPSVALTSVFWIATLAFGLNLAAFIADVVRSAIIDVSRNLIEAGMSLGMSPSQITRHVLFPLSIRPCIPSFALLCIHLIKMTSLASVISFPELTYVASGISGTTFRPIEPLIAITVLYLVLAVPLSWAQRWLERRLGNRGTR